MSHAPLMRALAAPLVLVLVALAAAPARAGEGAQLPPDLWPLIDRGLDVAIRVLLVIGPVLLAFYRRDRDAGERLLKAVPNIWDVVQQERRRGTSPQALQKPLERGLVLAQEEKGRPLSPEERARLRVALQAHHERMRAIGAQATPVLAASSMTVETSNKIPIPSPGATGAFGRRATDKPSDVREG